MEKQLNEIIKQAKEELCIYVHNLNSNEILFEYNKDKQVVSASTIKVAIMLYALNEVMNGNVTLETELEVTKEVILEDSEVFEHGPRMATLYELIMWMIITSDNTCTNVLINYFTMSKINEYCETVLETKQTSLQRIMLDFEAVKQGRNNYISMYDLYKMYKKIFYKEILNDELCGIAMKILCNQRGQDQIMRYIYEPTVFAHKTGGLDYLHLDSGIMMINDQWYYIGTSLKSNEDIKGNYPLIGKIGKIIYDELKGR